MPITLEFAHRVGGILGKVPKGAKITDTICEPNPTRGISQLVHCAVSYAAKGGTELVALELKYPTGGLWHFEPGSNPLPMWPAILLDPLNYKQSGSSRSLIVRVNPDGPRHKWCVKRRPTLTKENQIIRATRITRRL